MNDIPPPPDPLGDDVPDADPHAPGSDHASGAPAQVPVLRRSTLRRAAWLGVIRSAGIALVLLVAVGGLWTSVVAPGIAQRHGRADRIEQQLRGSLQSLYPSSEISPASRSVGLDGSLSYRIFVGEPDVDGRLRQLTFEFEVSATGRVGVDDASFWMDISRTETLRYRDTEPLPSADFVAAVARLPPGAVVSFAVPLPEAIEDEAAADLWRALERDGASPSGYLLAPDAPGNLRAWTGPDLDGYRVWDGAMRRTDGVAEGSGVVGVVGPDAGTAPAAAVTGYVFHAVEPALVARVVQLTGASEAISGEVGLRLPG